MAAPDAAQAADGEEAALRGRRQAAGSAPLRSAPPRGSAAGSAPPRPQPRPAPLPAQPGCAPAGRGEPPEPPPRLPLTAPGSASPPRPVALHRPLCAPGAPRPASHSPLVREEVELWGCSRLFSGRSVCSGGSDQPVAPSPPGCVGCSSPLREWSSTSTPFSASPQSRDTSTRQHLGFWGDSKRGASSLQQAWGTDGPSASSPRPGHPRGLLAQPHPAACRNEGSQLTRPLVVCMQAPTHFWMICAGVLSCC